MASSKATAHLVMFMKEIDSEVKMQGKRLTKQESETEKLRGEVQNMKKVTHSQGLEIAELQRKNRDLRNETIRTKIRTGMTNKQVADEHDMSPSNVSRIAGKRKHQQP